MKPTAAIVIPCLNEEEVIGDVVAEIRDIAGLAELSVEIVEIVVVDNGSTDRTAARAAAAGARVVSDSRRGYGWACLTGAESSGDVDILIYLDGDRSDDPSDLPKLVAPLIAGDADLVVGSRLRGAIEPGSLTMGQRFGNRISVWLLRLVFGVKLSDVGPFRAIRKRDLLGLQLSEMTYGWHIEMIAKGARSGLRIREVPVNWRRRGGGVSKVSGDVRIAIKTGVRVVAAIYRSRRKGERA